MTRGELKQAHRLLCELEGLEFAMDFDKRADKHAWIVVSDVGEQRFPLPREGVVNALFPLVTELKERLRKMGVE